MGRQLDLVNHTFLEGCRAALTVFPGFCHRYFTRDEQ